MGYRLGRPLGILRGDKRVEVPIVRLLSVVLEKGLYHVLGLINGLLKGTKVETERRQIGNVSFLFRKISHSV